MMMPRMKAAWYQRLDIVRLVGGWSVGGNGGGADGWTNQNGVKYCRTSAG